MTAEVKNALEIVAEVCAKSVGNLHYHRTIEQALNTILSALNTEPEDNNGNTSN
jgi:hypothetical protein